MQEVWKDIKGYEGLYQISNKGRLKSLKRVVKYSSTSKSVNNKHTVKEKIKNLSEKGNGYLQAVLYKNNKGANKYIHRLVAEAFIPNPHNCASVNHINLNKKDNRVENLEWCSYSYNNEHCRNNLNFKSGKQIKIECTNIDTGEIQIITDLLDWCKQNKHDRACVYKVLSGKYSQHHRLNFRYVK